MSGEEVRKSTTNTKESVTTCSYLQYIADSSILCNAATMSEAVTITDAIDPARAQALLASLGRPRHVKSGDVLPPLAHFAFFWEPVDEAQIGRDGHARTGGLIPDLGLPIRMWAGGRLTFHAPFRAGFAAQKVTTLHEVKEKRGRSGRLGLVTLKHEIRQRHAPVISEMQDIVYREPGPPSGNPPLESGKAHERHALKLREVTLFAIPRSPSMATAFTTTRTTVAKRAIPGWSCTGRFWQPDLPALPQSISARSSHSRTARPPRSFSAMPHGSAARVTGTGSKAQAEDAACRRPRPDEERHGLHSRISVRALQKWILNSSRTLRSSSAGICIFASDRILSILARASDRISGFFASSHSLGLMRLPSTG